jgi:single-strand DNA-binding protein
MSQIEIERKIMSNVFSFTGACGADAEVRYIPSGQPVLSVNVANNTGFGDKQKTMWIRVTVWGKRAESNLKDYLKKGQQVFVSGELTMSEYTANDGTKRTSLELNANIIDLVGGKRESAGGGYDAPAPVGHYAPQQPQYQQPPAPQAYQQPPAQHYAPPPPQQSYAPQPASRSVAPPPVDAPFDDDIPF